MTVEDIREMVKEIEQVRDDPEVAHSREDDLYHDLLHAIASGTCRDAAACAKEALLTEKISFPRWCA